MKTHRCLLLFPILPAAAMRASLLLIPLILLAGCAPVDSATPSKRDKLLDTEGPPPPWSLSVHQAAFSRDNRYLLVGFWESGDAPFQELVLVYDLITGRKVRGFSRKNFVTFRPIPRSANVLAVDDQGNLNLWDFTTGKLVQKVTKFPMLRDFSTKFPLAIVVRAVSNQGKLALISWARYREVRTEDGARGQVDDLDELWDVGKGKMIRRWPPNRGRIETAVFSPDEKWLFTEYSPAGESRRLAIWDLATGNEVHPFQKEQKSMFPLGFSPDGKLAITEVWGSKKSQILLWDWTTGNVTRKLEYQQRGKLPEGARIVAKVAAFSPDGKHLFSGGEQDMMLRCWELPAGKEVWGSDIVKNGGKKGEPSLDALVFSSDTTRAFTATGGCIMDARRGLNNYLYLRLWNLTNGDLLQDLPPLPDGIGR